MKKKNKYKESRRAGEEKEQDRDEGFDSDRRVEVLLLWVGLASDIEIMS